MKYRSLSVQIFLSLGGGSGRRLLPQVEAIGRRPRSRTTSRSWSTHRARPASRKGRCCRTGTFSTVSNRCGSRSRSSTRIRRSRICPAATWPSGFPASTTALQRHAGIFCRRSFAALRVHAGGKADGFRQPAAVFRKDPRSDRCRAWDRTQSTRRS